MTRGKERSSSLLGVTSYLIIEYHNKMTDNLPTGLFFNKVISQTNYKLISELGIDIKLPHCWYRYGDEVVRCLMPTEIRWNHESPTLTTVGWCADQPFYEEDRTTVIINETVQGFIKKYTFEDKESLVDEVYSRAPFSFQRKFRQLRLNLEQMCRAGIPIKDYKEKVILPGLREAVEDFLKEAREFPEVLPKAVLYRITMEKILSSEMSEYELAKELNENFWFYLCYHLRINRKCFNNVPYDIIEFWKSQIDEETEFYDRVFAEIVIELKDRYNMDLPSSLEEIYRKRVNEKKKEKQFLKEYMEDGLPIEEWNDFDNGNKFS